MARPAKEQAVREIAEKLGKAEGIYLVDFTGLNVSDVNELRRRFREAGVEYRVVKNTITRFAMKEVELEALVDHLVGPTALSLGYVDPVAPAKILRDFAKEKKLPKVKMGYVEGRLVSAEEVARIAELPAKDVLLGEVVSSLASPAVSLVFILQGILSNFMGVMEAIESEKTRPAESSSGED